MWYHYLLHLALTNKRVSRTIYAFLLHQVSSSIRSYFLSFVPIWNPSLINVQWRSTIDEVSQIIRCANSNGKTVSARSGGHSYAAYALSGDIVIDLGKLKTLIVDSSGLAVSQTGVLLGELAEGLWNQGQRALPHGTCPYVSDYSRRGFFSN